MPNMPICLGLQLCLACMSGQKLELALSHSFRCVSLLFLQLTFWLGFNHCYMSHTYIGRLMELLINTSETITLPSAEISVFKAAVICIKMNYLHT